MTFFWPEALPVLVLAPVTLWLLWLLDRARARRRARVIGRRGSELAPVRRRTLRRGLFTAAVLLAMLAVAQPLWGESNHKLERRGVDILVCLDVSRSMLARDVQPSRLEHAQRDIAALAAQSVGDRFGLVLFAGDAQLAVPLTRDHDSLAGIAALATPFSVAKGGSDLGAALSTALGALRGAKGDHATVVLLTDGEDLEGRALAVAEKCRQRNITVHCVGYGTALGAKIPDGPGFVRGASGREVVSALNPATLRRVAGATGGTYVHADAPALYEDAIEPMAHQSFADRERRGKENRFQWPLLGAFFFWIFELCVSEAKR